MDDEVRLTALVRGTVQGVGFRDHVRRHGLELGLRGRASNLPDGRVEVIAEGSRAAVQRLLEALRGPRTPGSVDDVDARWGAADGIDEGFSGA